MKIIKTLFSPPHKKGKQVVKSFKADSLITPALMTAGILLIHQQMKQKKGK
jgi:hypothetical protein